MRLLLDTQVWLWMEASPELLRPEVRERIIHGDTTLLLSAASSWEIAIKHARGKLPLPQAPREYVPSRMRASAVEGLPITHAHALHVATLPHHHKDPFDRLLVAQAQLEKIALVTADPQIERYDVSVVRAT